MPRRTVQKTKSVRFSENMVDKIQELADEDGISFSDMTRKLTAIGLKECQMKDRTGYNPSSQTASRLPLVEKQRLKIDVFSHYMMRSMIEAIFKDQVKEKFSEIKTKASHYLTENFYQEEVDDFLSEGN